MKESSTSRQAANTRTVSDFILERIRERFRVGENDNPPSIQNEEELAAEYGVHVQTIRSALAVLETEGILHMPRTESHALSLNETIELFEAREAIEGMAARLVVRRGLDHEKMAPLRKLAEKIDRYAMDKHQGDYEQRFHRGVVELCGNPLLIQTYGFLEHTLKTSFLKSRHARRSDSIPEHMKQEHVQLVDALQGGSEEDAERAFREHCTKVINFMIACGNDNN